MLGLRGSGRCAARGRDRCALQDVQDDLLRGAAVELGLCRRQQPVGEHRHRERLDVVGQRVVAPAQGGRGLGRPQQVEGRAGRGPESELRVVPGRPDQLHRVPPHRLGHVHRAHRVDQLHDLVGVRHRLEVVQRREAAVHVEHLELGLRAGVADRHPGHEAVPLGFGQRIGALHLHRVLGGHHHEGVGEFVRPAVDRDLPLLHRLQQCGLRLGRGAVDLVADHDLGEDRARLELEVTPLLVEDRHTGDVRGQQVRRELDTPHRAVDRPRQRLGQHGLADSGHVLDEKVPLRQQYGQRKPYDLGLALDHTLDRPAHPLRRGRQIREARSIVIGRHPALLVPLCTTGGT
ncbi:hypothetical protein GA0115235_105511 [Streptomyces sp. DpondAA-F4a]|nr:hypothetical protein GA0115235_105511 [Streptomyces sp. DpondAA-F4a]